MVQISLPHLNVLTKCDKVPNTELIEQAAESHSCADFISRQMDERNFFNKKFFALNEKIVDVIDNFWSVNFQALNIQDEETVHDLIVNIDNMVQYDEYRMPKDKDFLDNQEVVDNEDQFDMQM